MIRINSVLIVDEIEQECMDTLASNGIHVVKKTKLSEEQLYSELLNYDAVVVRSGTKITRKVIEATSGKLKLIGRAGTGVDNIDVTAATEHGILVMNTPAGNSRSATELTCSLILSLARNITQADASMKKGKWSRKEFMGEEVFGKTLAVIGLGRIGMGVASRMQTFGMKIVGYDPYVDSEAAAKKGVTWLPLEKIWPVADYITLHVPLTPQTKDLISLKTLKACKKGVRIINVARGGIVNEMDLVDSLNEGHVAGAAIDVFTQEPPLYREIVDHPKVISTPHLGASTIEAQQQVAKEIGENIVAVNSGNGYPGVLNGPILDAISSKAVGNWVRAVGVLAKICSKLAASSTPVVVKYPYDSISAVSDASRLEKALRAAATIGVLHAKGITDANLVNVELNAKKEGIQITVEPQADQVATVFVGSQSVSGYASQQGTFITAFSGSKVPVALLAVGTLAVSLKENSCIADMSELAKAKLCMEFGMVGGGRVATFSSLSEEESEDVGKKCCVIRFS